jgi:hypothetical protein
MNDDNQGFTVTEERHEDACCCDSCRTGAADCDVNPVRTLDPYAAKRAEARSFLGDRALIARPLGRLLRPRS